MITSNEAHSEVPTAMTCATIRSARRSGQRARRWCDGEFLDHSTSAVGRPRSNVEVCDRVCFEIDEAGSVFDYGRLECDSSIAYSNIIAFGRIRIVDDRKAKQCFCEPLTAKYAIGDTGRRKGFFPRLDQITNYAISIERMTGRELALPPDEEQWPAQDNARTPNAKPV